jgi:poly(U)-specific endoribonuclease
MLPRPSSVVVVLALGLLVDVTLAALPPPLVLTDAEILEFSQALRGADDPAIPRGVKIDYQGHTTTQDPKDNAPNWLFKDVQVDILRRPTFQALIKMLGNFSPQAGITEPDNDKTKADVVNFINTIFGSKPWTVLTNLLRQKNYPLAKDPNTLKNAIKMMWFDHYSRAKGVPDSSAFEHVFIGELKNGEVSGLHNWVTFYIRERNFTQQFDYKGFIVKRNNLMASVKFTWQGQPKTGGSFFIGTSPEYDMAVFTLCFLARNGQPCNIELDGCPASITTHDLSQNGRTYIGSAYPNIGAMTDSCKRSG